MLVSLYCDFSLLSLETHAGMKICSQCMCKHVLNFPGGCRMWVLGFLLLHWLSCRVGFSWNTFGTEGQGSCFLLCLHESCSLLKWEWSNPNQLISALSKSLQTLCQWFFAMSVFLEASLWPYLKNTKMEMFWVADFQGVSLVRNAIRHRISCNQDL